MLDGFFYQNDPGGITPDSAARKRQLALALEQSGMDTSPVQSWTQGAARLAQALLGSFKEAQVDRQEAAAQKAANAAFMSGFGGGPAASPAPASPSQASAPADDGTPFGKAVNRTLGFEGGYTVDNGGPTNFGISQRANPDVDVKNLTRDQAVQLYKSRYWDAIGGDQLAAQNPALASIAFDTAVNAGVGTAKSLLAQSGGDPTKLLNLRSQHNAGLIARDPEQYQRYQAGWDNRLASLRQDLGSQYADQAPGINYGGQPTATAAADLPAPQARPAEYRVPGQPAAAQPASDDSGDAGTPAAAPAPARNPYAGRVPWAMSVLNNPYSTPAQKQIAASALQEAMKTPETYTQYKDSSGNFLQRNNLTGQISMIQAAPQREGWHRVILPDGSTVQESDSGKQEAVPNAPPEATRKVNDALQNWKKYGYPDPQDPNNQTWWRDFNAKIMGGGGPLVTLNDVGNVKGEGAEAAELGKGRGARANELEAAAANAGVQISKISTLRQLLTKVDQHAFGPAEATVASWAQGLGIPDSTLSSLGINPNQAIGSEAAQKLINEMTVGMIGKGGFPSNNFSDADRKFLEKAFPSIANRPEANAIALDVQEGIERRKEDLGNQWQMYRQNPQAYVADLAQQGVDTSKFNVRAGQSPSVADFEYLMRQRAKVLPDMFADAQSRISALPAPGSARAGAPPAQPGAAPAQSGAPKPPPGAPPSARQAPDGNWYVPDPNRPGKYLMVKPNG